jgi:hypothetical protein
VPNQSTELSPKCINPHILCKNKIKGVTPLIPFQSKVEGEGKGQGKEGGDVAVEYWKQVNKRREGNQTGTIVPVVLWRGRTPEVPRVNSGGQLFERGYYCPLL